MTGNQKPKPSVVVKLLKYLYLSLCLLCPHIRTRYKCFASRCSANAEVCVCMAIARLERTQRGTHVTLPSSRRRTHLQRCATTPPRTLSRTLPSPAHTPAQTCLCPSKRACASTRCRARGAHHTSPSTGVTTPRLLSRLPSPPHHCRPLCTAKKPPPPSAAAAAAATGESAGAGGAATDAGTATPPPPTDALSAAAGPERKPGELSVATDGEENLPPLAFEPGVVGAAQKGVSAVVIIAGGIAFAGCVWGISQALFPSANSTQVIFDEAVEKVKRTEKQLYTHPPLPPYPYYPTALPDPEPPSPRASPSHLMPPPLLPFYPPLPTPPFPTPPFPNPPSLPPPFTPSLTPLLYPHPSPPPSPLPTPPPPPSPTPPFASPHRLPHAGSP